MASAKERAAEFTRNSCFHRSFTIPQTAARGPLHVTYATTTNFDTNRDAQTVLWVGPMFATRFGCFDFNHVAEKSGVRFITVDRAGTLPLLNTLARYRDILDPVHPYVALLAPWTHPSHSKVALWNVASKLPTTMITQFGGIAKFINTSVVPASAYSSGVFESMSSLLGNGPTTNASIEAEEIQAAHGCTVDTWNEINSLQSKYIFAGDSSGVNQETLLCLKKGCGWGACDDYKLFVDELVARERSRIAESVALAQPESAAPEKLRVRAFFSETDVMIGEGGQKFFEDCWQKENVKDTIDFKSIAVPNTNHDSIVSPRKGAWSQILVELGGVSQ
ncbi:hypothetical protein MBLNU459_g8498t1 [Dothideomycetes sp. NU459]